MSDTLTNIFYQSHVGSWAILLLLFILTFVLLKRGVNKGGKILSMVTRLFYLIMVVSGVALLIDYSFPLMYVVKGILAIALIGVMEMVLARTKRNESTMSAWLILLVLAVVVVLLGFRVISF